tara:strand:- start:1050 stop:1301 length:252 start_codon:yes stop_codon:yes gene_type:complete
VINNIKFYSTEWCGDCVRSKKLLDNLSISYEEIDIDLDKEAYNKVAKLQNRKPRIPTIIFEDGTYLVEPTDPELLEKINSYQN